MKKSERETLKKAKARAKAKVKEQKEKKATRKRGITHKEVYRDMLKTGFSEAQIKKHFKALYVKADKKVKDDFINRRMAIYKGWAKKNLK